MEVDEIIKEFWDESLRGLRWIKESGIDTVVFQTEGIDIVLSQERDCKKYNIWNYSEPGLRLFASLLKYNKQVFGELPAFDEINNVLGEQSESYECAYPVDTVGLDLLMENTMPVVEDGRLVQRMGATLMAVGAYMGNPGYAGFIDGEHFVISAKEGSGPEVPVFIDRKDGLFDAEVSLKRSVILDREDSLRVLKVINFYYPDKSLMESIYNQVNDPIEKWCLTQIKRRLC